MFTVITCRHSGSALLKKLNFCDNCVWFSNEHVYVIMLGGRLLGTESKRIYQISCLKNGRGRLRNLSSGRLRESFWNSIWLRNKTVIYKVVAYGRWSLRRSGRYERVDCTLTKITCNLIQCILCLHIVWCNSLDPFPSYWNSISNSYPVLLFQSTAAGVSGQVTLCATCPAMEDSKFVLARVLNRFLHMVVGIARERG